MVVGEVATATDVLVIGGGPGGYVAALRAAQLGRSVTLVERNKLGGTCLNVGCIPSKVFIHAAELAYLPEVTAATGVSVKTTVSLGEVQDHIRSVVGGLTDGVQQLLNAAGVNVVHGTARFSRANRVAVVDERSDEERHQEAPQADHGAVHIEFDEVILATGSRPIELEGLPFSDPRVLDSTGAIFGFDDVPFQLAVVGGGYIGVELGTAWAKLGAEVTIVEAQDSLLPDLDPRLGRSVARRLKELGVTVRVGTLAKGLDSGGLRVTSVGSDHDDESIIRAEQVVVCVGRTPNTGDLGLDIVGVSVDSNGLIPVDASRRAAKGVLAIGDITAGPALAHKATAEAEVAARTAAGEAAFFDPACVPAVVFSDPEVATVGMTTADAKTAGIAVHRFVFPISASARARTIGASGGQVELVADDEGTILGAHIAGPHASEIIGELALAIEMAATVEEIAATIHAHPTMSEGILEAAHGLIGMPLHVAGAKR